MREDRPHLVTQDPDYSECFQACVATIFQVDPDDLPPMGADVPSDEAVLARDQDQELKEWLRPRGLEVKRVPASTPEGHARPLPWGVCIACGTTNRDTRHAVVWDAGWWETNPPDFEGEMLHDPHPSRDGLADIEYYMCFVVLEPLRLGRDPTDA